MTYVLLQVANQDMVAVLAYQLHLQDINQWHLLCSVLILLLVNWLLSQQERLIQLMKLYSSFIGTLIHVHFENK